MTDHPTPPADSLATTLRALHDLTKTLNTKITPHNVAAAAASLEGRADIEARLAEFRKSVVVIAAFHREFQRAINTIAKGLRKPRWGVRL